MNTRIRSLLAAAAVSAMLLSALATAAVASGDAYAGDDFTSGDYGGGYAANGAAWKSGWTELGESDGPAAGVVRVRSTSGCSGPCLAVDGPGLVSGFGAQRTVGLPGSGMAELRYRIAMGVVATAAVTVQIGTPDSGWRTVETHGRSGSHAYSVGPFSDQMSIRFLVDGLGIGGLIGGPVGVDDVKLLITPNAPPTTATTTVTLPPIVTSSTIDIPTTILTTSTSTSTTTSSTTSTSTTTTAPQRSDDPDDSQREVAPPPVEDPPDSGTDGRPEEPDVPVIVDLDPGLAMSATTRSESPSALRSLLVPFGMRSEDLDVDLALAAVLGLVFAALSALRLQGTDPSGVSVEDSRDPRRN